MSNGRQLKLIVAHLWALPVFAIPNYCAAQTARPILERSVCQIDYFKELRAGEDVQVTGDVLSLSDGYRLYMNDHERCPDHFIAIRIPSSYSADSGIANLLTALYEPEQDTRKEVYLRCVCMGSLEYRAGMVVLNLSKVQRSEIQ